MTGAVLRTWIPAGAALIVALGAGAVIVGAPAGLPSAEDVVLNATANDAMSEPEVLVDRDWGDGRLLVVGFEGTDGRRHLAVTFAIDHGRGWRLGGYTEQQAQGDDVRVGSLLVATSEGGEGQPPWTAAYGELSDDRITRVEIVWDGETTAATLVDRAYLSVREGRDPPATVRYRSDDGEEIAEVPV